MKSDSSISNLLAIALRNEAANEAAYNHPLNGGVHIGIGNGGKNDEADAAAATSEPFIAHTARGGLLMKAPDLRSFEEGAVAEAYILKELWMRLIGDHPNGRGISLPSSSSSSTLKIVDELSSSSSSSSATDTNLSAIEIAKEVESIFNHYSLCRPGQGRSGRLLSTAAWKSLLRDCHDEMSLDSHQPPLSSRGSSNDVLDNSAVRFESSGTVPYAVADVIYTRCLRGEAARYGILQGPRLNRVQEEKGLTLETFAWALGRLALWLAPEHMRSSLGASAFGGSVGVNEEALLRTHGGSSSTSSLSSADNDPTKTNYDDNYNALAHGRLPLADLTSDESIDALLVSLFVTLRGARRLSGIGKGADLLLPASVAVLGANAGLLRTIFLAYSSPSVSMAVAPEPHSDGCVLPFERLEKAADDFRICPRLLARSRLFAIFLTVSPSRSPLLFSGFLEVMGRCALVSFGQHPLIDEFPNPEDQLDAFFARLRLSPQLQTARHELKLRGFKLNASTLSSSSSSSITTAANNDGSGGLTSRTSSSISSSLTSLSQAKSPTAIQLLGPVGSPSSKGQRVLTSKISLANAATGSSTHSAVDSAWSGFGQTVSELAGSVVDSARLGLGFAVGSVLSSSSLSTPGGVNSSNSRSRSQPPAAAVSQPSAGFSSITDIHKVLKTRSAGGSAAVLSPAAKIASPNVVHAVARTFAAVSPMHSPRINNITDATTAAPVASPSSSSPRGQNDPPSTSSSPRTSSASLSPGRTSAVAASTTTTHDMLSVTRYNPTETLFMSGVGDVLESNPSTLLSETAKRIVSSPIKTMSAKKGADTGNVESPSSYSASMHQNSDETGLNDNNNVKKAAIEALPLSSSPSHPHYHQQRQSQTPQSISKKKKRSSSLSAAFQPPKPPLIDITAPIKVGQLAGKPTFNKGFVTANSSSSAAVSTPRYSSSAATSEGHVHSSSSSGISQWSVVGDAPQRVHAQIQDSSFGVPVTIPVPNLAHRAAARMTATMGIAPISPNLLNSDNSKPMPPPSFNRPEGELTSQALVSFLCSEFSPLIPAIRPVFHFYARLTDPGNSGAMTHPSFISLLRDIDALDQKVTHGQVQLQIGLTHHSAVKAYKLRSEMLQLQGMPITSLPPPPVAGLLSEDDFLEALIRVSELVRKAQPAQKQQLYSSSSSSSSSSSPDEIETEMRRAKFTCANFIIRRVLPLVAVAEAQDEGAAAVLESEEVEEEMAKHLTFFERIFARYCRQLAAAPSLSSSSAGVGLFEPQFELFARHFELTPMLIPRTEVRAAFFASARRAGTDFSLPGKTGTGVGISGTGGTSFAGLWPRQNDPATGPATSFDESMAPPPSSAPAAFCAILGQPSVGGGKSGFGMFTPGHTTAAMRKGKRVGDGRAVLTTQPVAAFGPPPSGGFINRGRQQRDPLSAYLTFPSFLECLARLALVAFSKPYLVDKHPSLSEKILGLVAWMQATKVQHGDYNLNFNYNGEVDDVRRGSTSSNGRSLSLPRKQLRGDTNPTFEGDQVWSSSSSKMATTSLVVASGGRALNAFQRLGITAATASQKNKASSTSTSIIATSLPTTSSLADVRLLHEVPRITSASSFTAWRGRYNNKSSSSSQPSKKLVPFNAIARRALEDIGLFDLLGEEYGLDRNDDDEEEEEEEDDDDGRGGLLGGPTQNREFLHQEYSEQGSGDAVPLPPPPPPPSSSVPKQQQSRGRLSISSKSLLSRSTNVRSASEIPSTAASRAAAAMGNFFAAQTVPQTSTYWLPPPIDASLIIDGTATTAPSSVNTSGAISGRGFVNTNNGGGRGLRNDEGGAEEYDSEKHNTLFTPSSSSLTESNIMTTMDLLPPPPPPPSRISQMASSDATGEGRGSAANKSGATSSNALSAQQNVGTGGNNLGGAQSATPVSSTMYRSDVSVFHRGEAAFYARLMAGRAASMVKNSGQMFRAGLQVGLYDALDSARLSTYDVKLKTSEISSFKEPVSNGRVVAQEGVSLRAIEKIVAPEAGVDYDAVNKKKKKIAEEEGGDDDDDDEEEEEGGEQDFVSVGDNKLHLNTVTPVMLSKFTDGNPLVAGKRPAAVALKQRESAVNVLRREFLLRPVTSPHSKQKKKKKTIKSKDISSSSFAAQTKVKVPTLEEIAMGQYDAAQNQQQQNNHQSSQNGLTMEDLVNSSSAIPSSSSSKAESSSTPTDGGGAINSASGKVDEEAATTLKPQLQSVADVAVGGGRSSPSTSLSQPLTGELLKNYDQSLRLSVFDNSTPAERKAIGDAALRTGRPSPPTTTGGMRQGTNSPSTLVQWNYTSSIGTGATLPGELPLSSSSSSSSLSSRTRTVAMLVPYSSSSSSIDINSNNNNNTSDPHFLRLTESRENALIASIVAKPTLSSSLFKSHQQQQQLMVSSSNASTIPGAIMMNRPQTSSSSTLSSSSSSIRMQRHGKGGEGGGAGLSLLTEALSSSSKSGGGNTSQFLASPSRQTPLASSATAVTATVEDMAMMPNSAGDQLVLKREGLKRLYAASPSTGRPSIGPGSKGFSIKRTDAWSSVSSTSEALRELWDSVAPAAGKAITPSAKPAFVAEAKKATANAYRDASLRSEQHGASRSLSSSSSSSSSSASTTGQTLDVERLSPQSIVKAVFPEAVFSDFVQKSLTEANEILSLSGRAAPDGVTSVGQVKKLAEKEKDDHQKQPSVANPSSSSSSSSLSSSALFQLAYGGGDEEENSGSESYEVS